MKIKKLKRCNLQALLSSTETALSTFEIKRYIDRFGPFYDPKGSELEGVLPLERAWKMFLVKNNFIEIIKEPPLTLKVVWKVSESPTGRYRSFHKRGWPSAEYENGGCAAQIYCDEEYRPSEAKTGDHPALSLHIADHSQTPWKWRTVKQRYGTVQEAKEAFKEILKMNPHIQPGGGS
jgi:hypothetical protein